MNLIVKELCKLKILISLLLNNVFDAASKPNAKRKKNGFILYASNSTPLNSRVKIKQVL